MNSRLEKIYQRLNDKKYRSIRSDIEYDFSSEYAKNSVSLPNRAADRLIRLATYEKAVLFEGDRIGFLRTIKKIPNLLTDQEMKNYQASHFIFDGAQVANISSDYEYTIKNGLDLRKIEIAKSKVHKSGQSLEELQAMEKSIDAVLILSDKYKDAAKGKNIELYNALCNIPCKGATSFYEAAVFFRLLNFMLWLNGNKHNTLGRFDQYMYPYYKHDIDNGIIDQDAAKEILLELFMSLNFDSDLYPGIQQGDNGQSLMLGGCDKDGNPAYNELSELCLKASLELKLIDPKINLRVDKNTPEAIYRLGTLLTKQGLGFPQYSNDDIVIPALVDMGYELKDARDYVVAACWEFIIPKTAMDIPNIDALNFPKTVLTAINERLLSCNSFEEFFDAVKDNIALECQNIIDAIKNIFVLPSPLQSVLMQGCVENGKDISHGLKYNNFGLHGVGLSNAVDAISAIKKCVFENKEISASELIEALKDNFNGKEALRKKLINAPKMGNNDDFADNIAIELLNIFSKECEKYKNERGGIYRAGTGTAMYYIWYSKELGATADGRKAGEPFSANYSPSLNTRVKGVLSVIHSFTKPDLKKTCNGGPLTLEFHDTVFRNDEGINKVAALVKTFMNLGGHQLQLNAINRDKLIDAQQHPEKYPNLIVRVWGWSGYFNELDLEYQNHVIKRLEFVS